MCFLYRAFDGGNVLATLNLKGLPTIRFVPCHDIFGKRDLGVFFDGNVVVVPEHNEVAQLLRTSQGTCL